MPSRSPYSGSKSKLAIAIDIGTTYSGASYTFLVPGQIPQIHDVSGFVGQEDKASNVKVPSVLFYSPSGKLLARGAEVKRLRPQEGIKTEWFKLNLRPPSLRIDTPAVHLPPGRTIIDVFGDFLSYMLECVRNQIINTEVDGNRLWSSLKETAHFVLSHPNGWGSYQQGQMRDAAIRGGLVSNSPDGQERIEFVTEGEASFQWCIDQSIAESALKVGTRIIVADLGGGTIDVSSFVINTPRPLRLREEMVPECAVVGSITVTDRFLKATTKKLQGTPYEDSEYIETLREEFDDETKCIFREEEDSEVHIRIGSRKKDFFEAENGLFRVEFGHLVVPRQDVIDAFEPSVTATVNAIQKHIDGQSNSHVFLAGGFAASPWMLSETRRHLRAAGINVEVKRTDTNTAKAVAHGGIAFYLDRNVTERRMRYTYGIALMDHYNPSKPDHVARSHKVEQNSVSGLMFVPGGFFALVKKGELVKVESVYRQNALTGAERTLKAYNWTQYIKRYNGTQDKITFIDMDPLAFDDIGSFQCDVPASAMTRQTGQHGVYYVTPFDVVITLGTVELKAYIEWEENGVKKRTPAKSIWEDYY